MQVWVEQPVGTGYSTGNATATSEIDVAQQFMGFWKNFVDTFDLHGKKVYLSGESYAGVSLWSDENAASQGHKFQVSD